MKCKKCGDHFAKTKNIGTLAACYCASCGFLTLKINKDSENAIDALFRLDEGWVVAGVIVLNQWFD